MRQSKSPPKQLEEQGNMEPEESEAEKTSVADDSSDKGLEAEEDWGTPAEQVSETLAYWFLKTLVHHHDENPEVFWERFRGCWIMSPSLLKEAFSPIWMDVCGQFRHNCNPFEGLSIEAAGFDTWELQAAWKHLFNEPMAFVLNSPFAPPTLPRFEDIRLWNQPVLLRYKPPGCISIPWRRIKRWTIMHPFETKFGQTTRALAANQTGLDVALYQKKVTDTRNESDNTSTMQPAPAVPENVNTSHKRTSPEHASDGVEADTTSVKRLKPAFDGVSNSKEQPDEASSQAQHTAGQEIDVDFDPLIKVLQQKGESSQNILAGRNEEIRVLKVRLEFTQAQLDTMREGLDHERKEHELKEQSFQAVEQELRGMRASSAAQRQQIEYLQHRLAAEKGASDRRAELVEEMYLRLDVLKRLDDDDEEEEEDNDGTS